MGIDANDDICHLDITTFHDKFGMAEILIKNMAMMPHQHKTGGAIQSMDCLPPGQS